MNSVLLGVDFITTDEEILLLEMNTDINLSYSKMGYFDVTSLFDYILTNNFTTLRIIYKKEYINVELINQFKTFCTENSLTYDEYVVPINSVTIPTLEDNDTTLNLRFSYNAQAILDDIYCRDKNELVSLLFENNSENIIPKTYTKNNGVVLDNLNGISDNGNVPNLICKKELPDFNKSRYPEFYNVQNENDLDSIKSTIADGTFLQEYKFSPNNIEEGVITTHIRKWFLVTNQLTEIIDCGGYLQSNQIDLDESIIEYDGLKLKNMSRYMFFSNPNRTLTEGVPSIYNVDVKQEDGTFIKTLASNIVIGDIVSALNIDTLGYDFNRTETINWTYTGDTSTLLTYTEATVISVINKEVEDWFNKLTYTDGETIGHSLLPIGKLVLTESNGEVKFKNVNDLEIGDEIFNSPNKKSTITLIENEYFVGSMTMIDIEPSDVFIAGTNENEILNTLVVHNRCAYK
jgi:hypothetical protein